MRTDILTLRELALYLKTAEKTLYRLVGNGKIPGFKIGGAWRFQKKDIDAWLEKQKRVQK
jgi:excisionase family DNA binding protein